jgi:lipid-A-disaccharide synthase
MADAPPLRIALVAGEHSGDALGGKLMARLSADAPGSTYLGVGGETMQAGGLQSIFPLSDVAVMGLAAIVPALPRLYRRVHQTVDAILAARPDLLVIIDSPEFTHPIARRVRKRQPEMPIIDYVSPSVWAWRSGRARRMRGYIDHVLALLPFEPAVHERLGGPPCTYVGHPLIERLPWIAARDPAAFRARHGIGADEPLLVVLPGSRRSEVSRLMRPFGDAIAALTAAGLKPRIVIPVVEHVRPLVEAGMADWSITPTLVTGDEDKFAAFRACDAALAASGTVTLELALAGTPMVVGYAMDRLSWQLRHITNYETIVLANLVLGQRPFPEFLQYACNGESLAKTLGPLFADTPERAAQRAALACIPSRMTLADGLTPSQAAADVVLRLARHPGGRLS